MKPRTERTDQGEQFVLPGAGRISDRELAERRMAERMKPGRPQRSADEGLSDTAAARQGSLHRE